MGWVGRHEQTCTHLQAKFKLYARRRKCTCLCVRALAKDGQMSGKVAQAENWRASTFEKNLEFNKEILKHSRLGQYVKKK